LGVGFKEGKYVPLLHLVILALVQGLTEFLPISSSGHLALVPIFMEIPDQGLIMDVAVHVGTLGAVLLYLWRDVWAMTSGCILMLYGRPHSGTKLLGYLTLATLPVIGAGYAMNHYYPAGIRSIEVIGWATLGFGLVLMIADQIGMTLRRIEHLTISETLIIGFAQVLALIPGTSRSGICITAGRFLGMERSDVARFSILLSIPVILGAGALKGYELRKMGDTQLTNDVFLGAGIAFVVAFITVILLMAWLRRATFMPFAIYRVILGVILLAYSYGWIDKNMV
jgi:undecaprenyl-diphosphatase